MKVKTIEKRGKHQAGSGYSIAKKLLERKVIEIWRDGKARVHERIYGVASHPEKKKKKKVSETLKGGKPKGNRHQG